MERNEQLLEVIRLKIAMIDKRVQPQLQAMAQTDTGREALEDILYSMCAETGCAVQSAMSNLESDLK